MSYRALYWAARYAQAGMLASMRCVLSELAAFADSDGVAWPSVRTMAADLGMGERTVQRALRRLEDAGLISCLGDSSMLFGSRADRATSVWRLAVPDDILRGDMRKAIASRSVRRVSSLSTGDDAARGDIYDTPSTVDGVSSVTPRGVISGTSGVSFLTERGVISCTSGVSPVTPKGLKKDSHKDSLNDSLNTPLKSPHGGSGMETGTEETMYRLTGGEQVVTMPDGSSYSMRPGKCTHDQVTAHLDGTTSAATCPVCHASVANRLTHAAHAAHKETR